MKKHINKISTIQKAAAGIGSAVVVLASATDFFLLEITLSTMLLAAAANGGNRTVSDDANAKIEAEKKC